MKGRQCFKHFICSSLHCGLQTQLNELKVLVNTHSHTKLYNNKTHTYHEDLVPESKSSHGGRWALGYEAHKHTLAHGEQTQSTLALAILTQGDLTNTYTHTAIISTTCHYLYEMHQEAHMTKTQNTEHTWSISREICKQHTKHKHITVHVSRHAAVGQIRLSTMERLDAMINGNWN